MHVRKIRINIFTFLILKVTKISTASACPDVELIIWNVWLHVATPRLVIASAELILQVMRFKIDILKDDRLRCFLSVWS